MASEAEISRWNLHLEKRKKLFDYGLQHGLIRLFEEELFEKLRNYYFGGVPLSIILMCNKACNGFCYDRTIYIALGLEESNYRVVNADIDSLRYNPQYIDESLEYDNKRYANHCFLERTMDDGTVEIYDSSLGLVIDKDLYYEMENPVVTEVFSKAETESMTDYKDFKHSDLEREKYALPFVLPSYIALAKVGQPYYTENLKRELEELKKSVSYNQLCKEVEDDMKRMGLIIDKK